MALSVEHLIRQSINEQMKTSLLAYPFKAALREKNEWQYLSLSELVRVGLITRTMECSPIIGVVKF